MGGHQIRNQVLIPAKLPVDCLIFLHKRLINLIAGLAHLLKHRVRHMFRRHLKLPAYMVSAQFPEKSIVLIRHNVIEPYPGTDEYLLHPRQRPEPSKKRNIVAVICRKIPAWFRKKALLFLADPAG